METETSWEGQGFTLVIFICVVVLCSVFFILGMLAGRSQASQAAVPVDDPIPVSEESEDPDLTFYESVAEAGLPGLEPAEPPAQERSAPPPDPASPAAPGPQADAESPPGVAPEVAVMLQVGAFSSAEPAEELSGELIEKGFPAFVLRPGPGDSPSLNRVRIGPFSDSGEVERVRAELEADGHDPIVVQ